MLKFTSKSGEVCDSTLFRVILSIAFFTICSRLEIPLWPVPITMQMFAVYFLGMVLTPMEALLTTAGWIAMGAFGLPVFTPSSVGSFVGPTAGYRFGMIFGTSLISWLCLRQSTKVASCICGGITVHIMGCLWLGQFVGWENVFRCGVAPFIGPEIFKIALACIVTDKVQGRLRMR
jgi:biotin transport system substrate-specific component